MVKARNMFLRSSCNKYDANKTKKQRFYAVVFLLPLFLLRRHLERGFVDMQKLTI